MTGLGWLMMLVAVGGITSLFAWCIYKVFSTPDTAEHMHSQADIKPPDIES